ncbi:zinc-dependent alcohol dehydrogenase [Nocardioides nitrophenolicus]|uniref:zinc-dependent alcohol dehydrogenase n=1 Tax=Nocardioides nitrophenolicus TaxID=60489 RepID=UPI0019570DD2|nr:zinc-binding dehydrogenase [Nocardioides nitrophenolicus]MBM7519347.1 threonine dehydrogenase-like Zn-dependent dehydrogenase [Nocardioides nitrophenolicus]
MRAALVTGPGRLEVVDAPDPTPGAGELLIRTEVAAICGSDLHVAGEGGNGLPGGPGHESVGVVVESRSPVLAVGTRVLCTPPAAIAACFADLQVLPPSAVVPLPEGAAPERLVLAQQLGTAVFAMKRFWPSVRLPAVAEPRTAAVVGTGPAGLAFVQLLRRAGFERVIVSDLSPARLATATAYGATRVVHAPGEDVVEVVDALTDGVGVELAIEAAGTDATRHQAMRMVRDEGRVGLFGLYEDDGPATWPLRDVFRRRASIEMTWNAQLEPGLSSFAEAVDLVAAEPADAPTMITHRFGLSDIAEAFDLAGDPSRGAGKVAVTF